MNPNLPAGTGVQLQFGNVSSNILYVETIMTESEFYKKFPTENFELNKVHSKEGGFQDSIEEITYDVVDKHSDKVVARVKRTEVTNRSSESTIFWE